MNEVQKENKAKKGGQGSRSRSGIEGTRRGGRDAGRSLRKRRSKEKQAKTPTKAQIPRNTRKEWKSKKGRNERDGDREGWRNRENGARERERERRKTEGFEAETGEEEAAMD